MMQMAAGRILASAVILVALGLSPALGYATTHVLLGLAALSLFPWWLGIGPLTRPSADLSPQGEVGVAHDLATTAPLPGGRGRRAAAGEGAFATSPLFALAFGLITLSALITMRSPADLVPLLGFSALLFHAPLARLLGGIDLSRFAILGALVGLATALFYRYGLGMNRAAEGFWLTDPYRLAVTTLLCATLGLGTWFSRAEAAAPLPPEGRGWRWLSLIGLATAVGVILLTGSRTALLGLPALLFVTALCFVRRPVLIGAVIAATAAVVAAILFVELPGTARTRLIDVALRIAEGGTVSDAAINIRLGLYRAGTELFAANPLAGLGWTSAMMEPVRALLTPEQLRWGQVVHLHNDVLQFAVSGGVLGLAAWALILAAPIVGYLRLPRESRSPQRLHALLVLVTGALVLGLPDTFLAAPMTLTIYVVLTAAIVGRPGPPPP